VLDVVVVSMLVCNRLYAAPSVRSHGLPAAAATAQSTMHVALPTTQHLAGGSTRRHVVAPRTADSLVLTLHTALDIVEPMF